MSSPKQKLRLAGAFAALATLALAISCRGFFVNPTLSTITVDPPTPSVQTQATLQMTASATYNDGSGGTLTGSTTCTGNTVCWSSSDTSVATITTGGLLTGLTTGTATITAASGAINGTTSATVVLGDVTALTITPSTQDLGESSTSLEGFYAYATTSDGQQVDVSATATWVSNNPTLVTVENGEDPMFVTSSTTSGTTTITATYSTFTATATVTVTGVP